MYTTMKSPVKLISEIGEINPKYFFFYLIAHNIQILQ